MCTVPKYNTTLLRNKSWPRASLLTTHNLSRAYRVCDLSDLNFEFAFSKDTLENAHLEGGSTVSAAAEGLMRLESWKEIASFFKREVRTVQLWEQHEGLPVHRHHHRRSATVHAYENELREWWNRRCTAELTGETLGVSTGIHLSAAFPSTRSSVNRGRILLP